MFSDCCSLFSPAIPLVSFPSQKKKEEKSEETPATVTPQNSTESVIATYQFLGSVIVDITAANPHYSPVIFYLCQVHKRHPKPKKGVFLSVTTMISAQMVDDTHSTATGSTHTAFRQDSNFFSVAANIVRITCNISQVHYKVNHGRNLLKNTKNHHQK